MTLATNSAQSSNKFRLIMSFRGLTSAPDLAQTDSARLTVYAMAFHAGHDNKGSKSGWHLDRVEVTHMPSGRLYHFPCHRWLDTQQDDAKIVRVLQVHPSAQPQTWALSQPM